MVPEGSPACLRHQQTVDAVGIEFEGGFAQSGLPLVIEGRLSTG